MFFLPVHSFPVTYGETQVSNKKCQAISFFFGESDTLGVGGAFWPREFSNLKPNMIARVDIQAQPSQEFLNEQYGK